MFEFTAGDAGVQVTGSAIAEPVTLSWRWLRDHAEDAASRDPDTLQRRVDTFTIDPSATGSVTHTENGFTVSWADGTTTTHSNELLSQVVDDHCRTDWSRSMPDSFSMPRHVELWSSPADGPDEVDIDRFLTADDSLAHGVDQFAKYGYLVLRANSTSPAPDYARAEAFAKRLGYVRETIFGGVWDLKPDLTEHADTAYDTVYLAPHTDGTYSHDAPGAQYFLCVVAAQEGGESLLVDGFAIADELARTEPEVAATLASAPVRGRYIEPGIHLEAERPVFRTDARGELQQVSFNNYDRAPFLLPAEMEERFYAAYGRFAELANEPSRRALVTLTPGDLLIFDNWRTMHGRNAFRGARHYTGAYLNHEDLESKRRVLANR